jgi:hypothetical protein
MAVTPEVVKEVMDANSVTTIISNLNSLYSGAMSQVITYTAIIIGVVGILIPALSILFQWRSLKAEKKSLEKDIQEGIDNAKASIRADLITEMKEQISIEEVKLTSSMELKFKKLDEGIERSTASIFFLQGKIQLNTGNHAAAFIDYCVASRRFLTGNDYVNGQRALEAAIENCLTKINKEEYEGAVEKEIETLIKFLESDNINTHRQFHDRIETLKKEDKKAKLREPAKKN